MNRFLRLAALALVAILMTGCAVIQPVLPPTSQPDAASGYAAGGFTRVKSGGFAFGSNDFSCCLCADTLPQMPTQTPLAK